MTDKQGITPNIPQLYKGMKKEITRSHQLYLLGAN